MPNDNLLYSVENSRFIFSKIIVKNKKIYISNKVIIPISSNVLYNTLWRLQPECTKQFITICRGLIWPDCNEQITNFKRKFCRCPQFFLILFLWYTSPEHNTRSCRGMEKWRSDQYLTSLYNIHRLTSKKVMSQNTQIYQVEFVT